MNYEEKYRKALDAAKMYYKENKDFGADFLPIIFPELRESEDERIRKGLIKGLSAMRDIHKHQTFSDDAINIDDAIAWFEKQGEQKSYWSEEDEEMIDFMIEFIKSLWWRKDLTQRKDNVLSWLKSLKDRVQPQPKQEWSKEDEDIKETIIGELELVKKSVGEINYKGYDELINLLKSLKPNHWKPSEEQMEALKKRTHGLHASSETRKTLESLINELEKL